MREVKFICDSTPNHPPGPLEEAWNNATRSKPIRLPCQSGNSSCYEAFSADIVEGKAGLQQHLYLCFMWRVLEQFHFQPLTPTLWVFQTRHNRAQLYVTLTPDRIVCAAYYRKQRIFSSDVAFLGHDDYRWLSSIITSAIHNTRIQSSKLCFPRS